MKYMEIRKLSLRDVEEIWKLFLKDNLSTPKILMGTY